MLNHHGDDGEYCQYDDDGNSHLCLLVGCHCSTFSDFSHFSTLASCRFFSSSSESNSSILLVR